MVTWNRAFVWGWVAILATLIGYELYAAIWGAKRYDPTLTLVVVKYVPAEITLPFIFWMLLHFTIRYFD